MRHIFTICTADYIPFAKNVCESFLLHNPFYTFHVFIVNRTEASIIDFSDERIKIHVVDDLGINQIRGMQERYTVFEYCNSLKPFAANWLFDTFSIENLIYTDTDMMYFNKVSVVENLLENHHIVLTPHISSPIDIDGYNYTENGFLNAGLYNAGFFAISNSNVSKRFIQWWMERMESLCIVELSEGLFVDQIWLNLVPLFFDGVYILRDPSYNMGGWNLTERSFTPDTFMVNNEYPLVCYHYSGYDISSPSKICKYQNRYTFENRQELIPLYKLYSKKLVEHGLSSTQRNETIISQDSFITSFIKQFKKNLQRILR